MSDTLYSDSQLWRYLDGAMAPDDAEQLEREAQAAPVLAERLDDLRLIGQAIRDGVPAAPTGFATRVAATAQLRGASPRSAEVVDLRRFVRRALIAAAVLAAFGLGYIAVEVVPEIMASHLRAASDPLLEPR